MTAMQTRMQKRLPNKYPIAPPLTDAEISEPNNVFEDELDQLGEGDGEDDPEGEDEPENLEI